MHVINIRKSTKSIHQNKTSHFEIFFSANLTLNLIALYLKHGFKIRESCFVNLDFCGELTNERGQCYKFKLLKLNL